MILLTLAMVATAAVAGLAALSTQVLYLAIVFAGYGVTATVFYMTVNSVATIKNSTRKATALARLEFVYQIGFLVSTAGAATASLRFGVLAIFWLWIGSALLGAVLAAAAARWGRSEPRTTPSSFGLLWGDLRSQFGIFTTGVALVGVVEAVRDVYVPVALVHAGHRYQDAGYVFAISAALTGLGMLVAATWIDRLDRRLALSVSGAGMTVGLLLLPLATGVGSLGVVAGIISLARSLGLVTARSHAADTTRSADRATGLGTYELFFSGGKVAGSLAAGILIDSLDRAAPLVVAAFVVTASVVTARLVAFGQRQRPTDLPLH